MAASAGVQRGRYNKVSNADRHRIVGAFEGEQLDYLSVADSDTLGVKGQTDGSIFTTYLREKRCTPKRRYGNSKLLFMMALMSTLSLTALRVTFKPTLITRYGAPAGSLKNDVRQVLHFSVGSRRPPLKHNHHDIGTLSLPYKTANMTELTAAATPDTDIQRALTAEGRFIAQLKKRLSDLPNNYTEILLKGIISRIERRTAQAANNKNWRKDETQSALDMQFTHYMKCPSSVRWRIMSDPFTRRKFVPETPILAWNEHFNNEEHARLSQYLGMFGWKNMAKKEIAATLAALNSSHNQYLFDDRMIGDTFPKDSRCIRCAVIGNGGILNGSGKGKEIDANDYIFRVNTALTKGHEADVGTRTSFYCFGIITLDNTLVRRHITGFHMPPNDTGIRYVFFGDNYWIYPYMAAVLNRKPAPVRPGRRRDPPKFPTQLTASNVKYVHPDFQRYLKFRWVKTKRKVRYYRPTTGFIMFLLALHTCDEVNVYGFAGNLTKYSDHYYDKRLKKRHFNPTHDEKLETALLKLLYQRGIIYLYTRDD